MALLGEVLECFITSSGGLQLYTRAVQKVLGVEGLLKYWELSCCDRQMSQKLSL
jgi:hypothetical protein